MSTEFEEVTNPRLRLVLRKNSNDGMADWMGNLPKSKTSNPLIHLCIPGSHDSFTYSLDPKGPVGNDEPDLKPVATLLPFIKQIIYRWSKTQGLTVTEQCNLGIRYFDFRVSLPDKSTNNDLKIVHGLYGAKVMDILNALVQFSNLHPHEVFLLDFNHFYNFTGDTHNYLKKLITNTLSGKLVHSQYTPYAPPVTLDNIWANKQSFIVSYHDYNLPITLWPGDAIQSPWANTDKLDDLVTFLGTKLKQRLDPTSLYSKRFFVTQGIQTIRLKDIVATGGVGTLEDKVARPTTKKMCEWMVENKKLFANAYNIFIVDFVDMFEYANTVIQLNYP